MEPGEKTKNEKTQPPRPWKAQGKEPGTPAFARPPKVAGSQGGGGCASGCPVKNKRTKKKKQPHTHPPSQPQERLTTWDSKSEAVPEPPAGADPPQEPGPEPPPAPYLPQPSLALCVPSSSPAHAPFPTRGLTLPQLAFAPAPPDRRRLSPLGDFPLQTRASFLPASPPSPHTNRHTDTAPPRGPPH